MSFRSALLLLALLGSLLAINAADDWLYLHDDNGRRFSSYARSHLTLGLEQTRGFDFFYDARHGSRQYYGHHPPGPGLLVAGWFWLWDSQSPLVARTLAILFHGLTASILLWLLHHYSSGKPSLVAGLAFTLVPISSFFGKMVGYETLLLPFVLASTLCYWHWAEGEEEHWWLGLALILALVGLAIDWMILLALLVMGGDAFIRYWSGRGNRYGVAAGAIGLFGLVAFLGMTVWLMSEPVGNQKLISAAAFRLQLPDDYSWWKWFRKEFEFYRRYFTEPLLIASLFVAGTGILTVSRKQALDARLRFMLLLGVIGLLPVLIFPNGARHHAYWQFYCLPYAVLSLAYMLERIEAKLQAQHHSLLYAGVIMWLGIASAITLWSRYTQPSGYVAKMISQWQFFL